MRAVSRSFSGSFSSDVELPCTVSLGPDAGRKLAGIAVKINSASMVLRIGGTAELLPVIGEKVYLEVHLPVNFEHAGAKDLSIHGRIVNVTEMRDGGRQFVLNFRRAQFKDRNGPRPVRRRPPEGDWEN